MGGREKEDESVFGVVASLYFLCMYVGRRVNV
jgi:hypothetical protein